MEVLNAFIGKKDRPSAEEVSAALGPALNLWNEFIVWMAEKHGVAAQEWKGVCVNKYGWTLRLLLKKRTIVYLSPCQGCFRAALVLGDRAVAAAKAAKTSKKVLQALAEATRYPEGTGLRLTIKKPADLAAIRLLAAIKLAN